MVVNFFRSHASSLLLTARQLWGAPSADPQLAASPRVLQTPASARRTGLTGCTCVLAVGRGRAALGAARRMWFLTLVLLLTTSLLCYAGYIFLVVDKRQEKQERPPPRSTPGAQNASLSTCTRPALCCALAAPLRLAACWQHQEQSVWRAPRCPPQRVARARRCRRIVAGRLHADTAALLCAAFC